MTTISFSEIAVGDSSISTLAALADRYCNVLLHLVEAYEDHLHGLLARGNVLQQETPEELATTPIPVPSIETWAFERGRLESASSTCPWTLPVWASVGAGEKVVTPKKRNDRRDEFQTEFKSHSDPYRSEGL